MHESERVFGNSEMERQMDSQTWKLKQLFRSDHKSNSMFVQKLINSNDFDFFAPHVEKKVNY